MNETEVQVLSVLDKGCSDFVLMWLGLYVLFNIFISTGSGKT
jgi:hypothetical protein